MGTKGLSSYRYKGIYFTKYNHTDSYPSVLGRRLVDDIPADRVNFQEWFKSTLSRLEREHQALSQRGYDHRSHGYACTPSPTPPAHDVCIEWVYTIDLDRMAFSVDNGAHFRLDRIPRGPGSAEDSAEWLEYLALDGRGWRCLRPSTPQRVVADLHPAGALAPAAEGLALYAVLQPARICSSAWTGRAPASELGMRSVAAMLFRTLLGQYYGRLADVYQHPPAHPKFQGPAEFLLRAAAPGFLSLDVGVDEHERGREPGLQDTRGAAGPGQSRTFFWFRGCLVHLTSRLDSDAHLRAAVGDTVRRIRQRGLHRCTALLWSMRHVAVVSTCGEQAVAHSAAIPVLAAYGTDDAALESAIRLFAHYLGPVLVSDDGARDGNGRWGGMPAQIHPGIKASDTGETECSHGDKRPGVPLDVVAEIMRCADTPTYNAFRRVSRASRALWARRPRIGPYTVLFVPCPEQQQQQQLQLQRGPAAVFAAHDARAQPVRLRLAYHGRCAEPAMDVHALHANASSAAPTEALPVPMVLSAPAGVRCGAVMAELVHGVRHAVYVTQSGR